MEPTPEAVRAVMSWLGRRSAAKNPNKPERFDKLSPERRAEISRLGVAARRRKAQERAALK